MLAEPALTEAEKSLISCVANGEQCDLVGDDPADEASMRSWGGDHEIRARVIRDILVGRLVDKPDPHGLRLRGAVITDRLDLTNATSLIPFELSNCVLRNGLAAQDARLKTLRLKECILTYSGEAALDAPRMTVSLLSLRKSSVSVSRAQAAVQLNGAHIFGPFDCEDAKLMLDCSEGNQSYSGGAVLEADALKVDEALFMNGFTAEATGSANLEEGEGYAAVRLVGAQIGSQLQCSGVSLSSTSGPALAANGLRVGGAVFFDGDFVAGGGYGDAAVQLVGARITGELRFSGADLIGEPEFSSVMVSSASGAALDAERLDVGQNVTFGPHLEATGNGEQGAIRLVGGHIAGELNFSGAELTGDRGPALDARSLHVEQDVHLADGLVADSSSAGGAGPTGVVVNLASMQVDGTLFLDPDNLGLDSDRSGWLALNGLTYTRLPTESLEVWLKHLRTATPGYTPQPYRQLAAAYAAAGHDSDARRILIEQRRDQTRRGGLSFPARVWTRITGFTLGYGYQPWRALVGLLVTIACAILLALLLGRHGALAHPATTAQPASGCAAVEQVGVGLNFSLPLIKVNFGTCAPTATSTGQALIAAGWILQLIAWAFATLFIAGFTSAVRKS